MMRKTLGRTARGVALLAVAAALSCLPADSAAPSIGKRAPEYGGTTLQGDSVSLKSMEGKVVLLNLWATWCAPCRHETPFLQSLYEERREDGLEIVGISLDAGDPGELVSEFVGEYGVTYTILLDREGTLTWMRFGPVSETDTDFLTALDATLE